MLGIHGIRKEPELDRPYFGHIFTEEDKKNLRESGNMGRVADLNLRGNTTEPCLISIDKNTNELVAVRQEHVYIPNEIKGVTLTPDEIQKLKNGEQPPKKQQHRQSIPAHHRLNRQRPPHLPLHNTPYSRHKEKRKQPPLGTRHSTPWTGRNSSSRQHRVTHVWRNAKVSRDRCSWN